ncbi:MAG TPA: M48 family metallopeptidase [Allosphingosinicella sp.]|nr:M48 family metallopeptidase [Allosphingosinicella sp.]
MTSELRFESGGLEAALKIVVSPRARVMRLRVDRRNGAVVLTIPKRASRRKALEWAAGHRAWVEGQLARIVPASGLEDGAELPLYGVPHRIRWAASASRVPKVEGSEIVIGGPAENLDARILRWLRRHAAEILSRETREFAAKAGVSVSRVGVGDPSSRWGSCSSSGGIRYSWRLILAPDWVRRATVAHEVAHRVHMHHGPEFHALVERLFDADPKPARLWLRRHGAALHRIAGI